MKKFQYQDKYRRYSCDMHVNDWDDRFFSEFDPVTFVENIKLTNANAAMIYLQSHFGLSYWPTKVGEMHRGLIGKEDAFKYVFDELHRAGIDIIVYFSFIYNNWAYEKHPEWRMRDIDGNFSRDKGRRFGLVCPNSKGYLKFCQDQIADFSSYIGDYEAIFADMTFWPFVCYCDDCRKRWREEVGGEMPTVVDWKDERWLLLQKKRYQWLQEYQQEIYDAVKKCNPKCSVEQQNSVMIYSWLNGVNENATITSDVIHGDLYGGLAQQSFACKLYYNMSPNKPFNYTTSRCELSLDEHTTLRPESIMKQVVMLSSMHHGATLFVDAVDPVGTFDRRVYEQIGRVYAETVKYEPYIKSGELLADVGIFFNLNGKMNVEACAASVSDMSKVERDAPHADASIAVAETLQRWHIPYNVYSNYKPEQWKKSKILILSDAPNMSTENIEALRNYVNEGGIVYLSGHSAHPFAEEVFGGKITGRTEESITYMAPVEGEDWMHGHYTGKYPMTVYHNAFILEEHTRGEVLATLTLPYCLQATTFLVCADLELQKEADPKDPRNEPVSMHSDPPGIETEYPAVIRAEYGKGKVIWACAPFEHTELYRPKEIFAGMIRDLVGDRPAFDTNAPYTVECVLWDDKEQKRMVLGTINEQEYVEVLPVYDFDIWVAGKGIVSVMRVSDGRNVDFECLDGKIRLHVDRLDLYEMYVISYE